jgi:RimJ/RimL family protein N-acetyltransferase
MDHVGVLGMGVRRGFRGKGVGTCLLRETLKNAKDNGFEIVQLDVYGSNKPAIRIYKKSGFKVEGIRKRSRKHRGRYEDLVMMSKRFK